MSVSNILVDMQLKQEQSRYVEQSLLDLSSVYLEKAELKGREKSWKNFTA